MDEFFRNQDIVKKIDAHLETEGDVPYEKNEESLVQKESKVRTTRKRKKEEPDSVEVKTTKGKKKLNPPTVLSAETIEENLTECRFAIPIVPNTPDVTEPTKDDEVFVNTAVLEQEAHENMSVEDIQKFLCKKYNIVDLNEYGCWNVYTKEERRIYLRILLKS